MRKDLKLKLFHSYTGAALGAVLNCCKDFTDDDLLICMRDGTPEVWTKRAFEPGEFVVGPYTCEWKDRNWTYHRAALVKQSQQLHPNKQLLVLDGRLKSRPSEARPGSIFFMLTRSTEATNCNLKMAWATAHQEIKVGLPSDVSKEFQVVQQELPGIPIVFNAQKLAAHTKLVVGTDLELQKITDKDGKPDGKRSHEDKPLGNPKRANA